LELERDAAPRGPGIVGSVWPALPQRVALYCPPATARPRRQPRIQEPARLKSIVSFQSSSLANVPRLLPDRVESSWPGDRDPQTIGGTGVLPIEDVTHRDVLGEGSQRPALLVGSLWGNPQAHVAHFKSGLQAAEHELVCPLVALNPPAINHHGKAVHSV